jgi:4-hydroxybenzoate polyprenyltransferase
MKMDRSSLAAERLHKADTAAWLDGLFLLRPTLMFPLWTMVLAGHALVVEPEQIGVLRWILISIALTSLFGLVYLLNQWRDRDGDRANGKLSLVADEMISRKAQNFIALLLGIAAPVAMIASGFGHLGFWLAITFVVAGLLYNFSPVALERSPVGGIISGFAGSWLLLKLGEAIAGGEAGWLERIPYILAFTAGCILTSLPDVKGDLATGKRTLAVVYGERITVVIAGIMIAVAGVVGIIGREWSILPSVAVGMVFLLRALYRRNWDFAVIGNKLAIFLLSLAICWQYPWFLTAIVTYLPVARWYHRRRLGLDYPSFRAS